MNKIGIFFENPFKMGGTETWILNTCREYSDRYDITVYYRAGEYKNRNVPDGSFDRLASLVKVVPLEDGDEVNIDVGLWCFDYFHLEDTNAKEKYLFIHPGDGHGTHPRTPDGYDEFTGVIGVSQYTVNKMAEWCPGLDVKLVYNPVPPQQLRFLSMSRSAKDKGWERAKQLAHALNKRGVDYRWDVYTDFDILDDPSFNVMKPTISAIDTIRQSDFLVQLSDHESFGYSMVEGLQYSKLIITDIEILPEMGVTKDNAVIVPLENADYDKVVDDILARTYTPPQTDYKVLFGEPSDNVGIVRVYNPNEFDVHLVDDLFIEPGKLMTIDKNINIDGKGLKEIE